MVNDSISSLVNKQRDFFQSGKTRDIDFRIQQLKRLAAVIEENEADILQALHFDLGKSELEGYMTEVGFVKSELNFMIKNLPRWARPQKVKTPLVYFGAKSYIYSDPLGLVLIIGPWNYPFQLIIAPLIGAIAGGNCAVLKPSEIAPSVSGVVKKMMTENFPEEYIAVVEGGVPECSALLENRFDHIFYTGGPVVGRIIMEAASKHLTPVTLELGGKSPCIVDYNIDFNYAARRIAWGKFLNAGQTCVAPDYLMVHKQIKDKFLDCLKEAVNEFYGPDPMKSRDYSRIINDKHFERLQGLLNNGNIVCGGETRGEDRYIAPTIIDNISPTDPVMQEEIFGPILPVLEYEDLDEVICFINKRPKPLALYFFSRDYKKQEKVLRETTSGGVSINDTLSHMTTPYLPFGGIGESGMGKYHGEASFNTFVHKKSVLKNTFWFDLKVKYPPYTVSLQRIKKLMKFM
ncbi:aldehyde dehydrogenase [Thermosyntropha sp.]|uniref:aldehyde dehydrogenase n=1 Tax=Thermosyntropha sp. TaxID=2740820 RepID=UPI0025E6F62B|nr:aldehyde dehydrogenase [Thermosyntropha sp.]MBO8159282.1 aldehyde dehydrogenase [Thermosyntropha sp.]